MSHGMPISSGNLRSEGPRGEETRNRAQYAKKELQHRESMRAQEALRTLRTEAGSWEEAGKRMKTSAGYLFNVAIGRRSPSRRLLLALGVVKPEHRSGIRVRMTRAEAESVMRGVVPAALRARVAGQVATKECDERTH